MKKLIILLFVATFANAQVRKNETIGLPNGKRIKADIIQLALQEKDISFSGVILEKAKLADISKRFGEVEVRSTGDASTSNASICYFTKGNAAVRFNSGEMGGGKALTDVEVFDKSIGDVKDCIKSEREEAPSRNDRGIKLGLSRAEIITEFGKASYTSGNSLAYLYSSKLNSPNCKGGWDISESYTFRFKGKKVISFSVSKITSC